jgi:hypothetical protein
MTPRYGRSNNSGVAIQKMASYIFLKLAVASAVAALPRLIARRVRIGECDATAPPAITFCAAGRIPRRASGARAL